MNPRLNNIVHSLKQKHLDALLVTKNENIRYLTNFPADESWLLVSPKKAVYLTDFRYVWAAQKKLKGIGVKQYTTSLMATLFDLAKTLKLRKIGFSENEFSLRQYKTLKSQCPSGINFVGANDIVEYYRETKDAKEIQHIKKALKIHAQALCFLKKAVKPNMTERNVLWHLEEFINPLGVTFSFPPIIASGPNSCFPHAKVTDRRIRNNEPVLIDMGIEVEGYKSDLTRMFFLGKIPKLVEKITTIVRESQLQAIRQIRPGVRVADVDRAARNYLAKHKLDKYFGHSLGHGVGLEIHESPRLSQKSSAILREGMVVTVEPGVYLPYQFGVRIEDMVRVTKNNCEVLSGNID
jgi:Xaa-Pro aminopeptidase